MITCEVVRISGRFRRRFQFVSEGCYFRCIGAWYESYTKKKGWSVDGLWRSSNSRNTMVEPRVPEDVIAEALESIRSQIKYLPNQ